MGVTSVIERGLISPYYIVATYKKNKVGFIMFSICHLGWIIREIHLLVLFCLLIEADF